MTELERQIKVLEERVAQSRARIAQAEKQYKNSLAKLEHQKQAIEITRKGIDNVKIRVAQRLCQLQKYKESLAKKAEEQAKQAQLSQPEISLNAEPVKL